MLCSINEQKDMASYYTETEKTKERFKGAVLHMHSPLSWHRDPDMTLIMERRGPSGLTAYT